MCWILWQCVFCILAGDWCHSSWDTFRGELAHTQQHLLAWMVMESVRPLVTCPEHAGSWVGSRVVQKGWVTIGEGRGCYQKVNKIIEGTWQLSSTVSVFYMWGNWGPKGLHDLLEVTKLVGGRSEMETQVSRLQCRKLYHTQIQTHMCLPAVCLFADPEINKWVWHPWIPWQWCYKGHSRVSGRVECNWMFLSHPSKSGLQECCEKRKTPVSVAWRPQI